MQARALHVRLVALGALGIALCARPALADGAFPDSLALFAPPGRGLVLAANFGLIISDAGATRWDWICEAVTGTNAFLYQVGPGGTLFAVSYDGLKWGTAEACGWTFAGGSLANASVVDAFPDPTDPMRVFALARPQNPDRTYGRSSLYESRDGGRTFGPALFVAPEDAGLTGVEVARSDPDTLYLTMVASSDSAVRPYVVRSRDGGATWETLDAQASLGDRYIRLAAVDPEDPRRLYLRVTDLSDGESPDTLATSDDGGVTFRLPTAADGRPLRLGYAMSAFLRRRDGSLLIGVASPAVPHNLYASTDVGRTFRPVTGAPHVRALAERDGVLFAAADNDEDGYAIARSRDGGATWEPVLRFGQLCGPLGCGGIPSTCASDWERVRALVGIPVNACGSPPDAGQQTTPTARGCRCGAGDGAGLAGWGALLIGALAWRRSRRAEGSSPAPPREGGPVRRPSRR